MNRLGIENTSVFGLPPVEFVNLTADLACAFFSTGLTQININPNGYSPGQHNSRMRGKSSY